MKTQFCDCPDCDCEGMYDLQPNLDGKLVCKLCRAGNHFHDRDDYRDVGPRVTNVIGKRR